MHIDPDTGKEVENENFCVKINHFMVLPLLLYQLDGICWMMRHERKMWQGGIIGDEMGLGKVFFPGDILIRTLLIPMLISYSNQTAMSIALISINSVLKQRELEI
jgi:hypothetical protein